MHGILSGPEIRYQIEKGLITIDPYDPSRVNPASVDLTLGNSVKVYARTCKRLEYTAYEDGSNLTPCNGGVLDSKEAWETLDFQIPKEGWVLKPGLCYLMHTAEVVSTEDLVPILDGKSSIARMFVKVHETAGYGDPGFRGQYTLEVTCQIPVRVYAGMRFCQIRFHTIKGERSLYQAKGHYTGDKARGAVASQAWVQLREDAI
jgi:dCTP deaminase